MKIDETREQSKAKQRANSEDKEQGVLGSCSKKY
jgi:hypothetical protein